MSYCSARGATLLLAWIISSGDTTGVLGVTSALRPALATNPALVDPAQPAAAALATAYAAAATDGSCPAYYSVTLSAATSAALPIGNYLADLRFTFIDGSVQIAPGIMVTITEPATTA